MAATGGVRLVGPNCVGMAHVASGGAANFMAGCGDMIAGRAGSIAIVSQSGALGYTLLQAMHRGIGISHFLTAGNSADVDICDYISCLSEAAEVRAIVCMFEGVKSGRRLREAAARADKASKALIVYKAGNWKRAAGPRSRTRAPWRASRLPGSVCGKRSRLRRHARGGHRAREFFVKTRPPTRGRGVGIMATSGGAGVINADKAEAAGLPLPDLAPGTREVLTGVVPDFGSVANPCDTTAEVLKSSTTFETCLQAFADDPGFSAVVVPLVFAHAASSGARAPTLSAVAARSDCVIAGVWMNEWLEGPGSAQLDGDPRVVLFRSSERCFAALRLWHDWHDRRARTSQAAPSNRTSPASAAAAARALIATHRRRTPGALSEQVSKEVLAAYGITVPRERLAPTPEAAAMAAERVGFPVAAKIASPDIAHKTEIGGVRLNLTSAAAVGEAAAEILASARKHNPEAAIDGVSIQQMVPQGIEIVLGVRVDPQFGPLIVVGFGGIMVELLGDVATRLAPVGRAEAHEMLRALRGYRLLSGFRGQPPAAIDLVADAICRLSELAADLGEAIAEIDVNPLIVTGDAAIAADALVVPAHEEGRHD